MTEFYPHNDDLLRSPGDQQHAEDVYGPVAFALHFPQLLEHHRQADIVANSEKRRLRRRGLTSVGLVTSAILIASITPILHQPICIHQLMAGASAFLGIVGTIVAIRNSPTKWLEHRLATERLRQFHFSLLIRLAPDILEAARTGDHSEFKQKREIELEDFCQNLLARKAAVLADLTRERDVSKELRIAPAPDSAAFETPEGGTLLRAYRNLRIKRQCQYADHKLSDDSKLFSRFPRQQLKILSILGVSCVVLLLTGHVASALLLGTETGNLVHLAAIWIAITALALRVLEEGLMPRAEVERYRHYQSTTHRILQRFDRGNVAAKLQAAEELEQAAFDEMTIFLRAQKEARFVM